MKLEYLIAVIPCILIAYMIYKNDSLEKEPIKEIIKAFIMGMAAIFLTLFISSLFNIGKVYPNSNDILEVVIYAFIYIALFEELSKFICTYIFVNKNPNFNYLFDGIVYFVCVSLGFALIENLLYSIDGNIYTILLRGFTAIPAHTFFGICSGYYYVLYRKNKSIRYLFYSLIVPIILHGFYDFCILIDNDIFIYMYILFMGFLYYTSIDKIKKLKNNDEILKK